MGSLKEELLKPIWHAFTALDLDKSGKVSKSQLKASATGNAGALPREGPPAAASPAFPLPSERLLLSSLAAPPSREETLLLSGETLSETPSSQGVQISKRKKFLGGLRGTDFLVQQANCPIQTRDLKTPRVSKTCSG